MTSTNVRVQMQQRRDTAANWTSANPTLLNGELAYETDTGKWKLGDGSTAWSSLAYTPWGQISFPITTADIADDAVTGAKLANNIDIAGTLDVTSAATFDNNVTIQGDLTVNGTTTTIDTTTLVVEDKNIEMGAVSTPTDSTADGGGITLKGATDKTLNWVNSTDCWTFNQALDLTAGTAGAPALVFNSDVNTGLFQPGADSLAIATGGTQRVTVDSSGNVGIGTSPSSKLHVDHDINAEAYTIIENSRNYGFGVGIDFKQPFANAGSSIVGGRIRSDYESDSNSFFAFSTLQSGSLGEKLRIDSSGRLGLGTSSPQRNAHFNSSTSEVALKLTNSTSGSGSSDGTDIKYEGLNLTINNRESGAISFETANTERMRIDSSGRVGIGNSSPTTGKLVVGSTSDSSTAVNITSSTSGSGLLSFSDTNSGQGGIRYFHSTDHMGFYAADNERMRIDSSGRVGIGTATFDDTATALVIKNSVSGNEHTFLDIVCDTNESSRVRFSEDGSNFPGEIKYDTATEQLSINVNSSERMRIDSAGNVGIGTSSPSQTLTVQKSSVGGTTIQFTDSVNATGRLGTPSNRVVAFGGNADHHIAFGGWTNSGDTFSNERMRIDSSGRLLVGTSSSSVGNTAVFQGNSSGATFGAILNLASGSTSISDGGELGILSFSDSGHDRAAEISAARDGGTWTSNSSQPTRLVFATTANGSSSPTERMRIDSYGSFFNFSAGHGIYTQTTFGAGTEKYLYRGSNTSGSNIVFNVWSNGNVESATNSYGGISDVKLKENIVDASSQWDDLKAIQVRNYNFKESTGQQTHTQLGVVAQEVETVSPGLVNESPDTDDEGNDLGTTTKSVNYSVLYMKAVKALQEAMERIETLETKVNALEGA